MQFSVQTVSFFMEERKEGYEISLLPAYIWRKKNKQTRDLGDQTLETEIKPSLSCKDE